MIIFILLFGLFMALLYWHKPQLISTLLSSKIKKLWAWALLPLSLLFLLKMRIIPGLALFGLWSYLTKSYRLFFSQTQEKTSNQTKPHQSSSMSRQEALNILGLTETATKEDIKEAYRNLIQKLHPDHGGSDYLAAQINQARDILIESH
jgi:hypothetical protein